MDRSTDKACVNVHNLEIKNSDTTRKCQRSLEFANMEIAHLFSECISLFLFLPFNFSLSISLSNSLFLLSLFGRFSNHPLVCSYSFQGWPEAQQARLEANSAGPEALPTRLKAQSAKQTQKIAPFYRTLSSIAASLKENKGMTHHKHKSIRARELLTICIHDRISRVPWAGALMEVRLLFYLNSAVRKKMHNQPTDP